MVEISVSKAGGLKENIRMCAIGLGWKQFAITWSHKGAKQSVQDLAAHLKMIIKEEKKLTPPKDLAMEMPKHLEVPILGTTTQQLMENNTTARIDEKDFRKKQRNCKDRVRQGAKEVFSLLCNHSIVQSWMS